MELLGEFETRSPSLLDSIRGGRAVPVLGDEVLFKLILDSHESFVAKYAEAVKYPLDDKGNMPRMARYRKLSEQKERSEEGGRFTDDDLRAEYLRYVKTLIYRRAQHMGVDEDTLADAEDQVDHTTVTEFANYLGFPYFEDEPTSPLLVLANQDFHTFITTSPFTFIEQALARLGKQPVSAMCGWRPDLKGLDETSIADKYKPNKDHPLVYHLFGLDRYSDSIVLTEDDYLDFLVNISENRGDDARDSVHALARQAFSNDLIVLGYSLNSWAFRALYAGLIKQDSTQVENRGICCVQVMQNEDEKNYLNDYLQHEAKFEVFWGNVDEYTEGLRNL